MQPEAGKVLLDQCEMFVQSPQGQIMVYGNGRQKDIWEWYSDPGSPEFAQVRPQFRPDGIGNSNLFEAGQPDPDGFNVIG